LLYRRALGMRAVGRRIRARVGNQRLPALGSQVHTLRLPLEQDPEVGWKPHRLFRGSTPGIGDMGCHVSILDPGRQPHPPHRHAEEEILLILDGETDLVLEADGDPEAVSRHRAQRGTFAYYPTGFAHTIHNTADRPVTYAMFKWKTGHRAHPNDLSHRVVPLRRPQVPGRGRSGFSATPVLDGRTRCLGHLHAHVTTLEPGAGYAPHEDPYDVGIVVLEGTVETLGQEAGPHSVIYYPAGSSHGMRNVGSAPAAYLVFEFHRKHDWRRSLERRVGAVRRRLTRAG
jgi:uncharacterized cupin superfamily protein